MKFSFPDCGGCRSCELACSYRFAGEFDPRKSAVEVAEKQGGGYEVTLHEAASGGRNACDGCIDLEDPMCTRYCHSAVDLMKYIDSMREQLKPKEVVKHG